MYTLTLDRLDLDVMHDDEHILDTTFLDRGKQVEFATK